MQGGEDKLGGMDSVTPTGGGELCTSSTEANIFCARRFPIFLLSPRSSVSSRPSMSQYDVHFQGTEGLSEKKKNGISLNTSYSSIPSEQNLTVIYPTALGTAKENAYGDNGDNADVDTVLKGDNFGRTHVLVGGYFDSNDCASITLIPNELPRSTVLYVFTASEGRDKLFKCLQYALQLLMCILKRSTLFTPESRKFADYWAERFWRNSKTIRHGRMLFKLGRWVLNAFYLEEIVERIALKHGAVLKRLFESLVSLVSYYFSFCTTGWITHSVLQPPLVNDKKQIFLGRQLKSVESLVTDDMYSHVARAEFPWRGQRPSEPPMALRAETTEGRHNNTLTSAPPGASRSSTISMGLCMRDKYNRSVCNVSFREKDVQQRGGGGGNGVCIASQHDLSPNISVSHETFSSPPSIQSTLPESFVMGKALQSARRRSTVLLRPLRTQAEEQEEWCSPENDNGVNDNFQLGCPSSDNKKNEKNDKNNNNDHVHNVDVGESRVVAAAVNNNGEDIFGGRFEGSFAFKNANGREEFSDYLKGTNNVYNNYFSSYQVLQYKPLLGDALPSSLPSSSANTCDGGKSLALRNKGNYHDDDDDENNEESNEFIKGVALCVRENVFNDSMFSCSSNDCSADGANVTLGKCGAKRNSSEREEIPLEMGSPAYWRKRALQFSTPLMLLLGVRSIATIGRRVLRDLLLLLSERFLNISCVEKNRPMLQRYSNRMWLIVAFIDVFLNTIRLFNKGWYKYTTVGHSIHYRCKCDDNDDTDMVSRFSELIVKRKNDLFFPPVDLDFGAPICSSPAYFEAADPEHIAPGCRACGCLFVACNSKTKKELLTYRNDNQHQRQLGISKKSGGLANNDNDVDKSGSSINNKGINIQDEPSEKASTIARNGRSIGNRAEVALLVIPYLVRKLLNYFLLLRIHPNWTATIFLQVRYMAEFYLAFMYCFGGYETGKSDASLDELLHMPGAIAGLLGAVISLHRVIQSAPN